VLKESLRWWASARASSTCSFASAAEEFILLLPDAQEASAAVVAEQLRASVAETPLADGGR